MRIQINNTELSDFQGNESEVRLFASVSFADILLWQDIHDAG